MRLYFIGWSKKFPKKKRVHHIVRSKDSLRFLNSIIFYYSNFICILYVFLRYLIYIYYLFNFIHANYNNDLLLFFLQNRMNTYSKTLPYPFINIKLLYGWMYFHKRKVSLNRPFPWLDLQDYLNGQIITWRS